MIWPGCLDRSIVICCEGRLGQHKIRIVFRSARKTQGFAHDRLGIWVGVPANFHYRFSSVLRPNVLNHNPVHPCLFSLLPLPLGFLSLSSLPSPSLLSSAFRPPPSLLSAAARLEASASQLPPFLLSAAARQEASASQLPPFLLFAAARQEASASPLPPFLLSAAARPPPFLLSAAAPHEASASLLPPFLLSSASPLSLLFFSPLSLLPLSRILIVLVRLAAVALPR